MISADSNITFDKPYITDSLRMLLNVVKTNLLSNNDIQIVKGEHGIGKTTFCQQLKFELVDHAQTIIIPSNSQLHANDLFRLLLLSYQQKPEASLKKCLTSLSHYLKASIESVGTVVIIIYDSHLILPKHLEYILQSIDALSEILHSNLKLLLVGESSIEINLSDLKVERILNGAVHSSLIRPINNKNYLDFLLHLKKHASSDNLLFTSEDIKSLNQRQLKQLHAQSHGFPLLLRQSINTLFSDENKISLNSTIENTHNYLASITAKTKAISKKFRPKNA